MLSVVLGNLELLRKRIPEDPKASRLLDSAVEGARRGAALTQRMLAFARRQDLKPQPVEVPDLIRGMADLLRRSIGPTIRIETRFPLHLPRALVDGHQLELALLNLVVNARDAMPDGGTITISAREEGQTGFVCLSVADTGEGMDEATLAHASEPFFASRRELARVLAWDFPLSMDWLSNPEELWLLKAKRARARPQKYGFPLQWPVFHRRRKVNREQPWQHRHKAGLSES